MIALSSPRTRSSMVCTRSSRLFSTLRCRPSPSSGVARDVPPEAPEKASGCDNVLGRMIDLIRMRHYSYRTEQTYRDWVNRFFRYCADCKIDWQDTGSINAFLSYLATERRVASSTQNKAFNAIVFLFREVLKKDPGGIQGVRAKRGARLPVVLTHDEIVKLFAGLSGTTGLMIKLTYGAGLRVSETVRLRVHDLDFDQMLVYVRAGKGDKDRTTLLPRGLVAEIQEHLKRVKELHEEDLRAGYGEVYLPGALAGKYPNAPREWGWQYMFPARGLAVDPRAMLCAGIMPGSMSCNLHSSRLWWRAG